MPIQILSEQLASQIAAGEVVERPASVVKELVENAIDAGAQAITVDIRDGGRELIQIADDGCGMGADEVATAFLRHATSKLKSADDLAAIATLGFRGEALAAIASVSDLTIVTRNAGEESGTRLHLVGGEILARERVGAPRGTVIAVSKLFFNTPARLKFLKAATAERRAIDEFITRYALAWPAIRWRLTHNGRITFQTTGSGELIQVLDALHGEEIARALLHLEPLPESAETPVRVTGAISPPDLHRANRSQITFFVNGRWIHDQRLTYAVTEAYHTLIPAGRYPLAALFITMPLDEVDVNVHPAKAEVRFRQPGQVFSAVQRAVRRTLLASEAGRSGADLPFDTPTDPGRLLAGGAFDWQRPRPFQSPLNLTPADPTPPVQSGAEMGQALPAPARTVGGERLPVMRVLGQVSATWIITEGADGLFLIDQHAAHERILFEALLAAVATRQMPVQQLVSSMAVRLTPDQAALVEAHTPLLERLGFALEPFGPATFMLRGVPALLAKADPAQALRSAVEALETDDQPLRETLEAAVLRRVCKSAAVKAGQTLSQPEMEALVRQLEGCETPHTCPHGRPTLIHLSVAQMARQFGRT
jgi:DNA mismatch repair protein MutL